jgi:hypothetical protein
MDSTAKERIFTGLVLVFCFAILAWLNGRHIGSGAGQVALYSLLAFLLALAFLAGIGGLILAADKPLHSSSGYLGALDAVGRGFIIILPFTLLAILAEFIFKWGATQAFTQAGIMTAGAAVGMEVMRKSGQKAKYMIAPMAGAIVFSMAWIGYSALFGKMVG